jgi:hypothetical protein
VSTSILCAYFLSVLRLPPLYRSVQSDDAAYQALFLLSLLLSSLFLSFSSPSFLSARNNDTSGVLYKIPHASTREQDLRRPRLATGAQYDELIYHTVCWRGQQHEQESREWLFLGAHIYLCRFFFIMSQGWRRYARLAVDSWVINIVDIQMHSDTYAYHRCVIFSIFVFSFCHVVFP